MRLRLPLSAQYVCRVAGHDLRHTFIQGYEARHFCVRCGGVWPVPSVKASLHQDRQDMGADCITLGKCSTDGHTNEWPCDFA